LPRNLEKTMLGFLSGHMISGKSKNFLLIAQTHKSEIIFHCCY
jgi:hypothetical protein